MKQPLEQPPVPPTNEDTLNRHDAAQGVTTNPQDAGSGGGAPIGGHNQESRTWTQGGPSHGNPAKLTDREERPSSSARDTRSTNSEREARSTIADGGAAEEQDDIEPATDAKDSPAVTVDVTAGKTREKRRTM